MLNKLVRQVRQNCEEAWPTPSPRDCAMWLGTEVGELYDELMRLPGFPDVTPTRNNPRDSSIERVAEEAADVLLMLVSTVEPFGIDLFAAFVQRLDALSRRYSGRGLFEERR